MLWNMWLEPVNSMAAEAPFTFLLTAVMEQQNQPAKKYLIFLQSVAGLVC